MNMGDGGAFKVDPRASGNVSRTHFRPLFVFAPACANEPRPDTQAGLENQVKCRTASAALRRSSVFASLSALRRYAAFSSLPAVRARMLA